MTVDGELTAEAEGLFVTIDPRLAAEYFGRTAGEASTPGVPADRSLRHDERVQRIAIVGSGGAGKSMLARQIGAIAGLPVVHLDHHYWSPGWVPMPDGEWARHQLELLAGDRWVVDGNYAATLELRAERADTIVFLDLPRRVCLARAVRRFRSPILQADGCPQKVDLQFLRWIWEFPTRSRPRLLAILEHLLRPQPDRAPPVGRRGARRSWASSGPGRSIVSPDDRR